MLVLGGFHVGLWFDFGGSILVCFQARQVCTIVPPFHNLRNLSFD